MLLISDLHLTDKKADKYRWKIFPWVAEYFKKTDDKNLIILGDLTDAKDHHSGQLVNAIVGCLLELRDKGMEIFILKGNHDYIDPARPYFEFLDAYEFVNYIKWPRIWLIQGQKCLFLPHTFDPRFDWKDEIKAKANARLVFMHQTIVGSIASDGYRMEKGLAATYFNRFSGEVFSGDIHVPQTIGKVTYVGSPYSVRFNDEFEGRAIAIRDGLYVESHATQIPGRRTLDITDIEGISAPMHTQVKVRVHLADVEEWPTYREDIGARCKQGKLELMAIQLVKTEKFPLRKRKTKIETLPPSQIISRFGKKRGLSKRKIKAGRGIVSEAKKN